MIYLDYAATTPIDPEVKKIFDHVQEEFFANPDSLHGLGVASATLLRDAKQEIAKLLRVKPQELIMTSGATEANNMALFGAARQYQNRGKHIVTTKIEHASVYKPLIMLEEDEGFDITYLSVDKYGKVSIEDILAAITEETILVSVIHVNNEIGSVQPVSEIAKAVKAEHPDIIVHIDMAQSVGKVPIDLTDIDLATFSGHKFYAPKGVGMLYRKMGITLKPVFAGGQQEQGARPGTVNVAFTAAVAKAFSVAVNRMEDKANTDRVKEVHKRLYEGLSQYAMLEMTRSTHPDQNMPYFVHFRFKTTVVEVETYVNALSEKGACVATRSSCHSKSMAMANPILLAIGCKSETSRYSIRLSVSHLTKLAEIDAFLEAFKEVMEDLHGAEVHAAS